MRYERGARASHFVCIAFSFFILLFHYILEKRSNVVEATAARSALSFLEKKKTKKQDKSLLKVMNLIVIQALFASSHHFIMNEAGLA